MKALSAGVVEKLFRLKSRETLRNGIISGKIPSRRDPKQGEGRGSVWDTSVLPLIGENFGYLKPFKRSMVVTVYAAKGGVSKTTLALNIARTAAINGIKTCVVGTDAQGDISRALSVEEHPDQALTLEDIGQDPLGLPEVHRNKGSLAALKKAIAKDTSFPDHLHYIPEVGALLSLESHLAVETAREWWLRDKVFAPLRSTYNLIVADCAPGWGNLTAAALAGADVIVVPLACEALQFRALADFMGTMQDFRQKLALKSVQMHIRTRFQPQRKISADISRYYIRNVDDVAETLLRQSVATESAMAQGITTPEEAPGVGSGEEMQELLMEVWARVEAQASITQTAAA